MSKRKHTEAFPEGNTSKNKKQTTQRSLLQREIAKGQKSLTRAIKLAKGFERQKLGRRLKTATAKKDEKDITRINAEINAIKGIEPEPTAKNYLNKTLLKVKRIAESGCLPETVKIEKEEVKGSDEEQKARANVIARLCNANPTKIAMEEVLSMVRTILEIDEVGAKGKLQDRKQKKQEDVQETEEGEDSEEEFQGFSEDGREDEDIGEETEASLDSEGYAAFDARIAGSSDESDSASEHEDEDEGGVQIYPKANGSSRVAYEPDDELSPGSPGSVSLSLSPSISASSSPSASPEPGAQPVKPAAALTEKPKGSTFLPSLTMGGYWSGSEEASDLDEEIAPRKNRRGQRARQAIAEKKYGAKAKHLQNQKKDERSQGWDPRKGATGSSDRKGRGGGNVRGKGNMGRGGFGAERRGNPHAGTGANTGVVAAKPKSRDDEGSLHPSWQAAKKRKEEAVNVTQAFQGKKVVFD